MRRIGVLAQGAANDPETADPPDFVRAGAAGAGLERRPQRADRIPMGRRGSNSPLANMRPNWSRLHRTSSWPPAATACGPLLDLTSTDPDRVLMSLDPVAAGFVDSLAQPGGNATGFPSSNSP